MNVSPNGHLPTLSPFRRRISIEERRAMDAERLKARSLRVVLERELEARGITDPAKIGGTIGLSAMEAEKLFSRRRWHAGDLALLKAIAVQLGVPTT